MHPAITEIVELHEFFASWYRGDGPGANPDRLEAALHPGFSMVTPAGEVRDRAAVVEAVRRHRAEGRLSIEIEEPVVLLESGAHVAARYVEAHRRDGRDAGRRLATAIFVKDDAGPNGLRWVTVHETWID